jgi:hypothetical protein
MYKIYLIEDINGLKYVGKTIQKLNMRFSAHKSKQSIKKYSSWRLDLENSTISLLETCNEDDSFERERYWINYYKTVNEKKLNGYNKDIHKANGKKYRQLHKQELNEYDKRYYHYQKSWGGDSRSNNNLLRIDINLFV